MLAYLDRTICNAASKQRERKYAILKKKLDEIEKAIKGSFKIRALLWSVLGAHVGL
jgi:hypothetical protein